MPPPQPVLSPPTRSLQSRFSYISVEPDQPLRLRNAKGRWLELFTTPGKTLQLVESVAKDDTLLNDARSFDSCSTPARLGCALRVATWPGGSRAWLDSRGLLHLRSHDPAVPEVTLVMCFQAAIAGWCSNGARCGQAFYHGPDAVMDTAAVQSALHHFCLRIC